MRGIAKTENDAALEEIRKTGKTQIITLTPEEKAAWKKALEPVAQEMQSRIGKDVIDEFRKEAGAATH